MRLLAARVARSSGDVAAILPDSRDRGLRSTGRWQVTDAGHAAATGWSRRDVVAAGLAMVVVLVDLLTAGSLISLPSLIERGWEAIAPHSSLPRSPAAPTPKRPSVAQLSPRKPPAAVVSSRVASPAAARPIRRHGAGAPAVRPVATPPPAPPGGAAASGGGGDASTPSVPGAAISDTSKPAAPRPAQPGSGIPASTASPASSPSASLSVGGGSITVTASTGEAMPVDGASAAVTVPVPAGPTTPPVPAVTVPAEAPPVTTPSLP
jgi:hypothetical protein